MSAARMPSMYLPHGGGPSFFMSGPRKLRYQATEDFLSGVHSLLPAPPRAILLVSAHWESEVPAFTGGERPELIYDYSGFPPETYQLRYDAPGSPELAHRACALLRQAGHTARVDARRGWDHGVFIPLKVMFPLADIPVVAMSLQCGLQPGVHCDFGRALRPLRDEGVLLIGAGMSYHNLMDFETHASDSFAFHDWLDEALAGNHEQRRACLSLWNQAPGGRASHPRAEHLLPLMVASGAGSESGARRLWRGTVGPTCLGAWAFD